MKFKGTTLQRYMIKVIFPNFLLGVIIFSIINLIQYLYEFIALSIEKNIPFSKILKLLMYIIPFLMTFTIPVGVLIGVLLAMGELSAHSEIVAMRTNGLTKSDIFKPCIFFGLAVALLHIFFFQYILPWGNRNYVMTKYEMLRKNPTLEIANKKKFTEGEIEIRVERTDTKAQVFYGVRIVNLKENLLFLANKGKFLPKNKALNAFPMLLENVTAMPYVFRRAQKEISQHYYKTLKLYIKDFDIKKIMPKGSQLEGITALYKRIQGLVVVNVISEIKAFHSVIKKEQELVKLQKNLSTTTDSNQVQSIINRVNVVKLNIKNQKRHLKRLNENIQPKSETYLLHRKFSYATSAILMAFLAVPLGMINRRRGKEIAFGVGVLMVVGYNSLLIAGNFGWKLGYVSPIFGAWFPNIIIALLIVGISRWKLKKI